MLTQEQFDSLEIGEVIEAGVLFGSMTNEPICWSILGKSEATMHLSAHWEGVLMGEYTYKLNKTSLGYLLRRVEL